MPVPLPVLLPVLLQDPPPGTPDATSLSVRGLLRTSFPPPSVNPPSPRCRLPVPMPWQPQGSTLGMPVGARHGAVPDSAEESPRRPAPRSRLTGHARAPPATTARSLSAKLVLPDLAGQAQSASAAPSTRPVLWGRDRSGRQCRWERSTAVGRCRRRRPTADIPNEVCQSALELGPHLFGRELPERCEVEFAGHVGSTGQNQPLYSLGLREKELVGLIMFPTHQTNALRGWWLRPSCRRRRSRTDANGAAG